MLKDFVVPEEYGRFLSILKKIEDGSIQRKCVILNVYGEYCTGKSTVMDIMMKLCPRGMKLEPSLLGRQLPSWEEQRFAERLRSVDVLFLHLEGSHSNDSLSQKIINFLYDIEEKYHLKPTLVVCSDDRMKFPASLRRYLELKNQIRTSPHRVQNREEVIASCLKEFRNLRTQVSKGMDQNSLGERMTSVVDNMERVVNDLKRQVEALPIQPGEPGLNAMRRQLVSLAEIAKSQNELLRSSQQRLQEILILNVTSAKEQLESVFRDATMSVKNKTSELTNFLLVQQNIDNLITMARSCTYKLGMDTTKGTILIELEEGHFNAHLEISIESDQLLLDQDQDLDSVVRQILATKYKFPMRFESIEEISETLQGGLYSDYCADLFPFLKAAETREALAAAGTVPN